MSVRRVLTILAAAFAAYLTVRALMFPVHAVVRPMVLIGAMLAYAVVVGVCLLADLQHAPRPGEVRRRDGGAASTPPVVHLQTLPLWATVLALAVTVTLPNAVMLSVAPAFRASGFATSYIGAFGLLMTIIVARRRPVWAWAGVGILSIVSMAWLGVLGALGHGLIGSAMWVVAAHLLVLLIDRAAHDTARLARLQQTASAWRAAQLGRERERRMQVRRALAVAGPVLSVAVAQAGRLDDLQRREARIAEASLRDELRGARLLDDDVRARLDAARRRDIVVTVVDEGGLEDLDDRGLAEVRARLAEVVADARADRLYIRASTDPKVAVTVVGRSGTAPVDEDDVQLWCEIPRPVASTV